MLLPALSKSREQARRTHCISNLRQWGLAVSMYAGDHGDRVPSSVIDSSQYVHPTVLNLRKSMEPRCISVESITPYFSSRDQTDIERGGIYWCPSMPKPKPETIRAEADTWSHISIAYMYFARVSDWPPGTATRPSDLTDDRLEASRILMNDMLYHWSGNSLFYYNHGARPYKGDPDLSGLAGCNQLFGDGRVVWKRSQLFDRAGLESAAPTAGFVRGYSTTRSMY
jgi:hypothetical protein